MMHMFGGQGMGMGLGGMIFMILLWVFVIAVIIYLVRLVINRASGGERAESAEEILKKRYARGEISKEEFNESKKELEDMKTEQG